MKLNQQQLEIVEEKTGLKPLSDEAAAESGLQGHFGENSFYLGANGLFVFEDLPPQEGQTPEQAESMITAVQIAAVEPAEGNSVTVRGIEPQVTSLTIDLGEAPSG